MLYYINFKHCIIRKQYNEIQEIKYYADCIVLYFYCILLYSFLLYCTLLYSVVLCFAIVYCTALNCVCRAGGVG